VARSGRFDRGPPRLASPRARALKALALRIYCAHASPRSAAASDAASPACPKRPSCRAAG